MSDATIRSLDVGMLKGKINGVTIDVETGFEDGTHTLRFHLDERGVGEPEIRINKHTHPWGDELKVSTCDADAYADDIRAAREAAWDELEERNLDDPSEWHESSI